MEQQQRLAGQAEGQDSMGMKRVCGLLMAHKYRRMLLVVKMALKALQGSGYGKSGGRTYTRRWICCARSLTSIPTSAWSVYHSPTRRSDSSCMRCLSDMCKVCCQTWRDGFFSWSRSSFHSTSPSPFLNIVLTSRTGHRVSRCCRATYRRLQLESFISLPDSALQRRLA